MKRKTRIILFFSGVGIILLALLGLLLSIFLRSDNEMLSCPKGTLMTSESYNNGIIYSEGCIDENNIKQGNWTYYREDGSLEKKGKYIDNTENGTWIFYRNDGETVAYTQDYINGLFDGKIIYYYDYVNGIKRSEYSYVQGILSGDFAKYYENGGVQIMGIYGAIEENGRIIGKYNGDIVYFDEKGNVEKVEVYSYGEIIS